MTPLKNIELLSSPTPQSYVFSYVQACKLKWQSSTKVGWFGQHACFHICSYSAVWMGDNEAGPFQHSWHFDREGAVSLLGRCGERVMSWWSCGGMSPHLPWPLLCVLLSWWPFHYVGLPFHHVGLPFHEWCQEPKHCSNANVALSWVWAQGITMTNHQEPSLVRQSDQFGTLQSSWDAHSVFNTVKIMKKSKIKQ